MSLNWHVFMRMLVRACTHTQEARLWSFSLPYNAKIKTACSCTFTLSSCWYWTRFHVNFCTTVKYRVYSIYRGSPLSKSLLSIFVHILGQIIELLYIKISHTSEDHIHVWWIFWQNSSYLVLFCYLKLKSLLSYRSKNPRALKKRILISGFF